MHGFFNDFRLCPLVLGASKDSEQGFQHAVKT
jgi:hypothetical protein